ncbi:hypothetical protein DFJ77DRAFT_441122 [Powellomyces hirtus]|nr:hypothetical protein DFJ77DRAFT_441122 [Powellomyces hirtus]
MSPPTKHLSSPSSFLVRLERHAPASERVLKISFAKDQTPCRARQGSYISELLSADSQDGELVAEQDSDAAIAVRGVQKEPEESDGQARPAPTDLISAVRSLIRKVDLQYEHRLSEATDMLETFVAKDQNEMYTDQRVSARFRSIAGSHDFLIASRPEIAEYKRKLAEISTKQEDSRMRMRKNHQKHQAKMSALMAEAQKITSAIQKRSKAHDKTLKQLTRTQQEATDAHLEDLEKRIAAFKETAEKSDKVGFGLLTVKPLTEELIVCLRRARKS